MDFFFRIPLFFRIPAHTETREPRGGTPPMNFRNPVPSPPAALPHVKQCASTSSALMYVCAGKASSVPLCRVIRVRVHEAAAVGDAGPGGPICVWSSSTPRPIVVAVCPFFGSYWSVAYATGVGRVHAQTECIHVSSTSAFDYDHDRNGAFQKTGRLNRR